MKIRKIAVVLVILIIVFSSTVFAYDTNFIWSADFGDSVSIDDNFLD